MFVENKHIKTPLITAPYVQFVRYAPTQPCDHVWSFDFELIARQTMFLPHLQLFLNNKLLQLISLNGSEVETV